MLQGAGAGGGGRPYAVRGVRGNRGAWRLRRAAPDPYPVPVEFEFDGEVIWWKGPSPFHFVPVPDEESAHIEAAKSLVTYGWGVIPVTASIGDTQFTTSLFPKDGRFLVPVKDAVRRAEGLDLGDVVTVHLTIDF